MRSLLLSLLGIAFCASAGPVTNCTWALEGQKYDLSKLVGPCRPMQSGEPFPHDTTYTWGVSVCGNTCHDSLKSRDVSVLQSFQIPGKRPEVASLLSTWPADIAPVLWTNPADNDEHGLKFSFRDGDDQDCGVPRSLDLIFVCSEEEVGGIVVSEPSSCHYAVRYATSLVCGDQELTGHWEGSMKCTANCRGAQGTLGVDIRVYTLPNGRGKVVIGSAIETYEGVPTRRDADEVAGEENSESAFLTRSYNLVMNREDSTLSGSYVVGTPNSNVDMLYTVRAKPRPYLT